MERAVLGRGPSQPRYEIDDLTAEDRALLWKHRVTLTDNKHALLKLFHCLNWKNQRQVVVVR